LDRVAIRQAMKKTMAEGVRDRVIVHCKEACFALDAKGNFTEVLSLNVPKADIKGTVGAGDAFCAGCLFGIYNNYTDQQLLEFASAAAACSLLEANAVDGMRNRNDVQQLAKKYGRISQ
jgi:sugar/nucleoside kinase (ribokinase family)